MMQSTQAPCDKLYERELMMQPTQAPFAKLSESELMMQPTQAPCAKLSESELMVLPTQAPSSKLSESELMMQPTQAPFGKLSDSELMIVETQALSMSKLSESQLMGFPTQAFNLSKSQMLAVETQAVNKLSESELMLASTQAMGRLSESEIMSAETQNISNLSDSAATQVMSPFIKPKQKPDKSSESELMIAPTQKITLELNIVDDIETKSESESMTAETQAFIDDKEANEHDAEEEEETQKVDKVAFSNQDVEGEEGNEETMPFDLSPAISNDSLNLMDGEENISEEEHEEEEQQDAPVDMNSEELLNADTQSVPSVKNYSDEILPSSNDKVECSQSLFDAETDDFMVGIDSKSNTPVESEVLDSKDKEEVEDKNDSESEDDMFIESSQGPIQNNRSRLRELSTMSQSSVVPSSQLQDDLNVKSKNPVQIDSESNVSEADSDNLMDDQGDVTDDDLQALFNKNRRQDSDKLSQTLSIPGSQPRPSSEVIPPSQEAEKLSKIVKSKLTLTTNYSVKSMEETNLDYQSSQETDSEFKETLSGLIDNLEVSRNDIEETMIEGNNETVTGDSNIQNISLVNEKSVAVKTPIKVSSLIIKEKEEVSSPIIAKNHSSQSIKSLDTSNDSRKTKSSLADILGNDDSESEDDAPLTKLPDIDQDSPIAATDEIEIGSDIKEKDTEEDGVDQAEESETPQRKSLKLAEIVMKTPTQVRLCKEVKEGSPMRPESGPFLPDTLVSYCMNDTLVNCECNQDKKSKNLDDFFYHKTDWNHLFGS